MGSSRDRSVKDPDGMLATVAQCIEHLRQNSSTLQEKEFLLIQLSDLVSRENTLTAVGSHSQVVPVLVSLLRAGSFQVKIQAANVLGSLCKENDLRVKVLLGGCIPPLLSLLKSASTEAQLAAATTIHAVSHGGSKDHIGSKIFSTEGVVPVLWKLLENGLKSDNPVDNLLMGALRNLSCYTDGFYNITADSHGVDVLINLLKNGGPGTKADACYLISHMMTADASICDRILKADVTKELVALVGPGREASVRAEAAAALKSLSQNCKNAKFEITNCGGIPALINATIAPSKEFMKGEYAYALQENTISALANIFGGLTHVISSLSKSLGSDLTPVQCADTLGALASALMIYDSRMDEIKASDPCFIERVLVGLLEPGPEFVVQERTIEALASLYGNDVLSSRLIDPVAKRLLVCLVTTTSGEVHDDLMKSLLLLCNNEDGDRLWRAVGGREGVQLLISFLGLATEEQQECVVSLICLLSEENDESKWAVTAAGGIPPLVQILESGSAKAREDSAMILGNLSDHSEDIRACVESADCVPALLWLLKNGTTSGKGTAARTLNRVIRRSDTSAVGQLTALLTADLPESKVFVLESLKSMLSVASLRDLVEEGSAANDAVETMVKCLSSAIVETRAVSAASLSSIFQTRRDLRESTVGGKTFWYIMKHVDSCENEAVLVELVRCLASIFLSVGTDREVAAFSKEALPSLLSLVNSSGLDVIEQAVCAISNILLDSEVAERVVAEEVLFPATRVLVEGSGRGKALAATTIARLLGSRCVDRALADCVNRAGTVPALVSYLECGREGGAAITEALDALSLLVWCREEEENGGKVKHVWSVHFPKGITPVVHCIPMVEPVLQDKAIEILSRLCRDGSNVIGEAICGSPGIGSSIARRVVDSVKMNVKIGGCMILISGGKVDPHLLVEELSESYLCVDLVRVLVSMLDHTRSFIVHGVAEVDDDEEISICRLRNEEVVEEEMGRTAVIYGTDSAPWLLSLIARFDKKSMVTIMEAGAIEIINERISQCSYKFVQVDFREENSTWLFLLLLAILFQDIEISDSQETVKSIPLLANILKSDDITSRYFAAQAISSLVRNGNNQTILSVANSGVATGLISLLGCAHGDIHDLIELANDFTLFHFPEIEALEGLFRVEGIGDGPSSQKAIPALVDLLKPIPERPGAPILALGLLTLLAHNTPSNSAVMVESGVLEALTRYLSLGPQDTPEEAATDLLGTLFATAEIRTHESAPAAVTQLVAVLRLGGRSARYSAALALERLFSSVHIRNSDNSLQAVHPLVETLNTGSEREQQAAIGALVKLLIHNSSSKAHIDPDAELTMVDALYRILSSDCLVEVKGEAAELCGVLFGSSRVRTAMGAARCIEPLLSLLLTDGTPPSAQLSVVHALDRLLDDDQLAELVAAHGSVIPLVGLLYGREDELHEAVCRALVKLGKDRPFCKIEMVKSGVIENVLEIITEAPVFLSTALAELLRILTNNVTIARGPTAAKVVEPLFILLSRAELGQECRHSTLQVLVNILEHRTYDSEYTLTAQQAVDSLIPLLDVHITAIQKLVVELLSHLLQDESVRNDPTITHVIGPLTQVIGSGSDVLQQGAVKALVSIAGTWPNEIAKEGGVNQLSKVILQTDPSFSLWETAASVLASILQFSSDYFLEVPVAVLVRLLRSTLEPTIVASLNTLLVLESDDGTSGEAMAESGAIGALLELLKCHQCEESAARLLEVLLNNVKIREAKETKSAILPLSQYLLDPLTVSVQARLLASLALGDLFQNEGFSRTGDAQSACRALVNVLEDQPTEELKVVAICALQNLVMYSRSNKRAVAEAGGVQVLLDLIGSSEPETSVQASIFIKLLFSNHTIQEYASSETVRALTAAIEKELWATGGVNEEYLKALNALFNNFTRLRATEPATLTIPHLVASLKTPVEATQEAALDTLFLLRQAWSSCPAEISRAQSVAAADAIPLLQYLIQSGPPRFQEKAEFLLQCLPGTLVVIIKRGNNMKQAVGNPSLYCKLMLANTPPKQTKILSTGPNPEWDESFSWSFECPPKGQKLQIACKNKSKMGKSSFGKVTIQIDRVVMLGCVSGEYALVPESKSGSSRNLEIEFQWSNT